MSLPEGIPTVTVTGRYLSPSGVPLSGAVVWRAPLLTFADSDVILGGPVSAPLDAQGAFKVTLPATDAPGMVPSGWAYSVGEQLVGVAQNRAYSVLLPAESPVVDIADLAPTDPATPNYVAVRGDSAYEVAVEAGFTGTEAEWLASLVGPPGVVQSVNGQAQAAVVLSAADVGAVALTGDQTVAGKKTFTDPVNVRSAVADALLLIEQTDTAATAGVFKLIGGNAQQAVFLGRGQEHTANAWAIRADGTIEIGDGTGGRDVVLSRVGVNDVSLTANIRCTEPAPTEAGHLTRKDYVDGRTAADVGAVPAAEKGAPSGVAELDADGVVPAGQLPPTPNVFTPADLGLKAWAFDPGLGQSTEKYPSSGSLRVTAVRLHTTETVSSIVWHLFGYNAGITSGNAGIYDADGVQLRTTGDLSVPGKVPEEHGVGGHTYAIPLTSPVTLAAGIYYLAFYVEYTSGNGPAMLVSESNGGAIPTFYGLSNVVRFAVDLSAGGLPSSLDLGRFGQDSQTTSPNKFWQGLA